MNEFEQITLFQSHVNKPAIYLDELQRDLQEASGSYVSLSTICWTVDSLGFTGKRVQQVADQRSGELRAQFMAEISVFEPHTLYGGTRQGQIGSECMWGLGEGSNFQLVRGPQN